MTRGGPMRVTERAQRAVLYARSEASRLGHDRVGTEHLLLALLRDEDCLAVATLGKLGIPPETVRRRVEETVGPGQGERGMGFHLPMTKPAALVLALAGREVMELDSDRLGTEHLLLALAQEHPLPSGDRLVLLSLEVWSDWLDLRYAVVYATPEPEGELPRPEVIGGCEVSDRAGTEYVNWTSSHPGFGMVRVIQRTFVPAPPVGTELLELRFSQPDTMPGEAPPLIVSTVDLR